MNHWPFIIAAYSAFVVLVTLDVLLPTLELRKQRRRTLDRLRREQHLRHQQSAASSSSSEGSS